MLTLQDLFSEDLSRRLDNETLEQIISTRLPGWKRACEHAEGEMVILNQMAFGQSTEELLLLGIAAKYAGIRGRHVVVNPAPQHDHRVSS